MTICSELSHLCKPFVFDDRYADRINNWISEHIRGIPEKLEALISEKRFLSAVELLQDALKTMREPNMDDIGALSDLRVYLSNQEHVCILIWLNCVPPLLEI